MAKKGQRYPYRVAYLYPNGIKGSIALMSASDVQREAQALEGRGAAVTVCDVVESVTGARIKVPMDDWKTLLAVRVQAEQPKWERDPDRLDALRTVAQEIGADHGWKHAAYVDAYGGELHTEETLVIPERYTEVADSYLTAYLDGQDAYADEKYLEES